jgi:hypothetical protein
MHSDPDILAMMAMGEPNILPADERHVELCPQCLEELESLRRVTSLARAGSPLDSPLAFPRPEVWAAISGTLGLAPEIAPAPFPDSLPAGDPAPPTQTRAPIALPSGRDRGRRFGLRRRRLVLPLVAAAAALLIGAGGILFAWNARQPGPKVIAEARLNALPDWAGSSGTALVEARGTNREVVVTVAESRPAPGYREVWLISSDLKKLISIGVLTGTEGSFAIPADVSLKDYPIVDVSSEKPDGNPAHSGDSIVRGVL